MHTSLMMPFQMIPRSVTLTLTLKLKIAFSILLPPGAYYIVFHKHPLIFDLSNHWSHVDRWTLKTSFYHVNLNWMFIPIKVFVEFCCFQGKGILFGKCIFSCRLQSMAAHRNHFVGRLFVCLFSSHTQADNVNTFSSFSSLYLLI